MKFEELRTLARRAREVFVKSLKYDQGGPPRCGETFQFLAVCKALHEHILAHGQIQIDGLCIGISPAASHSSGLRPTNPSSFRLLLFRLIELEMDGVKEEVEERWKAVKQRAGTLRPEKMSESEKFQKTTFAGFD